MVIKLPVKTVGSEKVREYPKNLERLILDYNPTNVHLRFKEGTDNIDALTEIGYLLSDFYDTNFKGRSPYPEIKKFGIKKADSERKNRTVNHGWMTFVLWGKRMNHLFYKNRHQQREEEFHLGFFNIYPSRIDGFGYQLYFSRRVNDFTAHKYEVDPVATRKDAADFYRYVDGLLKTKKPQEVTVPQHR